MAEICTSPCPVVQQDPSNSQSLRRHLMGGAQCVDAWLALASLVQLPSQQIDCLKRAAGLRPGDLEFQIAQLERIIALDPEDRAVADGLRQARATRALVGHSARAFARREPARELGAILMGMGEISEQDLRRALTYQRAQRDRGKTVAIGDVMVARGLVTPALLAKALIVQYEEKHERGDAPRSLGEYLISAGYITLAQLEHALIEQAGLRNHGQQETLGNILVRRKVINTITLQRALDQQRDDVMHSFL